MRQSYLLAVAAFVAAQGCGDPVAEFRDAAPSNQGLEIAMRKGAKTGQGLGGDVGQAQQELIGDPALMPGVTALSTGLVNGGVAFALGTVAAIVTEEPASIEKNKVVWGPLTQPLWKDTFRLTMTKEGKVFRYVLEGRSKAAEETAPYAQVMTGSHELTGLRSGQGSFTLSWDEAQKLANPSALVGSAVVTYQRNDHLDVAVSIDFQQVALKGLPRGDAKYTFSQAKEGDGAFEFALDHNLGKGEAKEHLSVKSRWHWDGAGRSDVTATGGDLTSQVRFTECWDSALNRSFYQDTLALFPTEGQESSCAFSTASFSSI